MAWFTMARDTIGRGSALIEPPYHNDFQVLVQNDQCLAIDCVDYNVAGIGKTLQTGCQQTTGLDYWTTNLTTRFQLRSKKFHLKSNGQRGPVLAL